MDVFFFLIYLFEGRALEAFHWYLEHDVDASMDIDDTGCIKLTSEQRYELGVRVRDMVLTLVLRDFDPAFDKAKDPYPMSRLDARAASAASCVFLNLAGCSGRCLRAHAIACSELARLLSQGTQYFDAESLDLQFSLGLGLCPMFMCSEFKFLLFVYLCWRLCVRLACFRSPQFRRDVIRPCRNASPWDGAYVTFSVSSLHAVFIVIVLNSGVFLQLWSSSGHFHILLV